MLIKKKYIRKVTLSYIDFDSIEKEFNRLLKTHKNLRIRLSCKGGRLNNCFNETVDSIAELMYAIYYKIKSLGKYKNFKINQITLFVMNWDYTASVNLINWRF